MPEPEQWREWDLSGLSVTQLRFDYALHVHLWSLERDLLIRFGTPFTLEPAGAEPVTLDPERAEQMPPVLPLLHRPAASFAASSLGRCVLRFEGGAELRSQAHPAYEAWESHGSGPLESASLLCTIGPDSPWG